MKEMRYKSYKTYQNIIKWQCPINSYYKCKCIKVPRSRKAQIRRMDWGGKKKKTRSNYMLSKRDSLYFSGHTYVESKRMEKIFHAKSNKKELEWLH